MQPIQSKAGTGQSVRLSTAGIFYLNPNPTNGERLHAKEYRYVRGKKFQQLHALLMSQLSPIFVQFHHPSRRSVASSRHVHPPYSKKSFTSAWNWDLISHSPPFPLYCITSIALPGDATLVVFALQHRGLQRLKRYGSIMVYEACKISTKTNKKSCSCRSIRPLPACCRQWTIKVFATSRFKPPLSEPTPRLNRCETGERPS